jgi:H+/gluconate symporter-like permease
MIGPVTMATGVAGTVLVVGVLVSGLGGVIIFYWLMCSFDGREYKDTA